ncbi:hypothetical protein [Streptomyces barkulensis]|uniref:hypothetical protein n=1 Tax=Streptomyces barkulensis TaxID=1257026 RepID=UPI000C6EF69C|nr:hypothetical protein [Streptomyces barkulensis]
MASLALEALAYAYVTAPDNLKAAGTWLAVPASQQTEFAQLVETVRQNRLYAAQTDEPSSWVRVHPEKALEAASNPLEPTIGRFAETPSEPPHGVFYAGCVNSVIGPSESGKSWLVQYVVAQELRAGNGVVYVDYEDDAASVYRRLLLLGVPEEVLRGDRFRYHQPNGPMTEAEKAAFMASVDLGGTLAVFDGVTEGMALEGLSPRDEAEVATWHARTTKDLAHGGWGVAVIDHTPHDGNRALGSQHKKSCITGASYLVEAVQQVAPGEAGRLRLKVEKDRHGSVRREAAPGPNPRWRGDLTVDFTGGPEPVVTLWPASPRSETDVIEVEIKPEERVCRAVVQYIAQAPGCTAGDIEDAVKARKNSLLRAKRWLIDQGFLKAAKEGNRVAHYIGRPLADEAFDPV